MKQSTAYKAIARCILEKLPPYKDPFPVQEASR